MENPKNCTRASTSDSEEPTDSASSVRSDTGDYKYVVPTKCVKSVADMCAWQKSQAYYDLVGFINGVSVAIQGKKLSDGCFMSDIMIRLLSVFKRLNALVDETPPVDQPQRFGNQAYRTWYKHIEENIHKLLLDAVTEKYRNSVQEIAVYFMESFGNKTRIDYGTGHELSFIMFMCCLFKIGALEESDNVASALKLFNIYLIFVRRLQKTYRMEPAGSHGVWSLDDYQFVPFIWGSAQLAINSPFDPQKYLDPEVIEEYKNEYMFISCIDYICQVKTGHFAEHSNQLWSISAVQSWAKINSGLVKMYQKEILSKFPVVQHVLFGSLMAFTPIKSSRMLSVARLGTPLSNTTHMPPPSNTNPSSSLTTK